MISLPKTMKVYLCVPPTDMRKSFDGLCGLASEVVKADPLSGHLFLFRNRARDRVKLLYWDGDGLAIWYKRLEKGTFQFPTDSRSDTELTSAEISPSDLQLLLDGVDLGSVRRRARYQLRSAPPTREQSP